MYNHTVCIVTYNVCDYTHLHMPPAHVTTHASSMSAQRYVSSSMDTALSVAVIKPQDVLLSDKAQSLSVQGNQPTYCTNRYSRQQLIQTRLHKLIHTVWLYTHGVQSHCMQASTWKHQIINLPLAKSVLRVTHVPLHRTCCVTLSGVASHALPRVPWHATHSRPSTTPEWQYK